MHRDSTLLLGILFVLISGCSGEETSPVSIEGPITFELEIAIVDHSDDGDPTPIVRNGQLEIYTLRLAADDTVADADTTRLAFPDSARTLSAELEIQSAGRFRIEAEISGIQWRGDERSESGILYLGQSDILNISATPQRAVDLPLYNLVPIPTLTVFPQVGYTLEWSRVDLAVGYELREESDNGVEIIESTQQERFFEFPPGLRAAEDELIRYRVRTRLSDDVRGAYSAEVALSTPSSVPPARVTDLSPDPSRIRLRSIGLRWTTPGDDGNAGQASEYDLRYSTALISEENFLFSPRFENTGAPGQPGSNHAVIVSNLEPETDYFFALKTADELPNWSELSNVLTVTTLSSDSLPPHPVFDLVVVRADETEIELGWTAPSDDDPKGSVVEYEIRYSEEVITIESFESATRVEDVPAPSQAGTAERFTVENLFAETRYFFALRSIDARGNASEISNVAIAVTPDQRPPATIDDLAARGSNQTTVFLNWTAPGDDGRTGTASAYDLRISGAQINDANFDSALAVPDLPAPRPGGEPDTYPVEGLVPDSTYFFALKAVDDWGNFSGISNVVFRRTDP